MTESGYSLESQLALDDAWIAFVDEFERLRDETEMVDAPEPDRNAKPQVPQPRYSVEQLKEWLDIPLDGRSPSAIVAEFLQRPTEQDWAAIPWSE